MRLTLRTLLAYLDDTLEPTEIKQIGQKVAESDAAQELIARIKQITRRRRLTTPPLTGPGAANFDPNTVAEYLDNALSGEQIAEVEKLCLESDVHLAEIATCHQILTLVLGEPALVPPTARERMYGLVQGKESIPFRKAAITTAPNPPAVANGAGDDADDLSIGHVLRRGGWPRWVLPAAGVLLVAGLVLTMIKVMTASTPRNRQVAVAPPAKADGEPADAGRTAAPEKDKPDAPAGAATDAAAKDKTPAEKDLAAAKEPVAAAKDKPAGKEPVADKGKSADAAAPATTPVAAANPGTAEPAATAPTQAAPAASTEQNSAPRTDRREIGTYTVLAPRSGPTLLVQRQNDQAPWQRLTPGGRVFSNDPLVSLPGYLSDVRLDSGVHIQLRGLLPEFAVPQFAFIMNSLLDSSVVLHANKDVDLDFTLNHGRVYLSNHKEQGPAKVRVRFENEVWMLTLAEPDTEVIVELMRNYLGDMRWQDGEEPWTRAYLGFIKGKGALSADYKTFADLGFPGKSLFSWDNKGQGLRGPNPLTTAFQPWDKAPPVSKDSDEMGSALEDLSKRMTDKKPVDVVLMEELQSDRPSHRVLAIYALAGLDEVRRLIDVLGEEDPNRGLDRIKAIWTIQRWLSNGAAMGKMLYDTKARTGILTENRKYLTGEAETVLKLLYGFSASELRSGDIYRVLADYLMSPKIGIRELAIGHLIRMGAPVKFNPAWPEAERQKYVVEINKLVDEHKLPPQGQGQGQGQGPPPGGQRPAGASPNGGR